MIDQIIMSVITGVAASICFMLFLLLVRPNIKIATEMCKDPCYDNLYRIKVVNKSRAILNNVDYSLHYCEDAGDGIKEIREIPPRKSKMTFWDKYSWKCEDYAVRLSYEIDPKEFPLENAELEFTIMAYHSFSNTMCCKKQIYKQDHIREGIYQAGKSMRILCQTQTKNGNSKESVSTSK